jgi:hypothetical protein
MTQEIPKRDPVEAPKFEKGTFVTGDGTEYDMDINRMLVRIRPGDNQDPFDKPQIVVSFDTIFDICASIAGTIKFNKDM